MRPYLVALAALASSSALAQEKPASTRADTFFERLRFAPVETPDAESRRVVEILKSKEHWVGAYRFLEERFGKFPDNQEVAVDFGLEGDEELGVGGTWGVHGRIRFNLKRLARSQKFLDELEAAKQAAIAEGKRIIVKVPPFRIERVIYHELTHILQRNYDAPEWFLEGMAQYVAGEEHQIYMLAFSGRRLKDIEEPLAKRIDAYGRGHLFWNWLHDRGSAAEAIQLSIILRKGWKEALEEATKLPWSVIVPTEREWSAKQLDEKRQ